MESPIMATSTCQKVASYSHYLVFSEYRAVNLTVSPTHILALGSSSASFSANFSINLFTQTARTKSVWRNTSYPQYMVEIPKALRLRPPLLMKRILPLRASQGLLHVHWMALPRTSRHRMPVSLLLKGLESNLSSCHRRYNARLKTPLSITVSGSFLT
jgi:hypothetical protein